MVLFVGTCNATWENCATALDGFLYGGNIAAGGKCKNCVAQSNSFGAWDDVGARNITVAGTFENCVAKEGAFGFTSSGDATFSGYAKNCKVDSHGYAVASGVAECSGKLEDCDNGATSGWGSFGYSYLGIGSASGTFTRCHSGTRSFGCSSAAAVSGYFSGTAIDCDGSTNCFGANDTDNTFAQFSGTADRCTAGEQSFGARGKLTGQAHHCEAGPGSFGDQDTLAITALLDSCTVIGITEAAGHGPPGMYGGIVRNCWFSTADGATSCALLINGDDNYPTKVLNCDLIVDPVMATASIDRLSGATNVKIAHCRMNLNIGSGLTNLIAMGYNVVDTNLSLDILPH